MHITFRVSSKIYNMTAEGRYTTSRDVAVSLRTDDKSIRRITEHLKEASLIHRGGTNRIGKWRALG